MTQNASDVEIANQGFAAFRQDLNDVLEDITTLHSGTAAPTTTYANQWWYEEDTDKLYIRNEDNDAWVEILTIDQANDHLASLGASITLDGTGNVSIDSGDFTVDTSTLHVDSTNNLVGIRTSSPDDVATIGSETTAYGSALTNHTLGVRGGVLGGTAGNTTDIAYFGSESTTNNTFGLSLKSYRQSTGNGWETTGFKFTFNVDGSDALRDNVLCLDSTGNVLVGTTDTLPASNNDANGFALRADGNFQASRSGAACARFNRGTSDGEIMSFHKDGTIVGLIGVDFGDNLFISGNSSHAGFNCGTSAITPYKNGATADNSLDLGSSTGRWDDIFATNATIQTSDQNEKQQIASLTDAEITAAKAISKLFKTFKWNDKVEEKGDAARTHTGVIAQDVQQAMTDAGLDATKYAFWCSDTWWETQTEVPAVEAVEAQDAVYDEDGNLVTEAVEAVEAKDAYTRTDTYETAEEAPEGATERTRLGIRYPELLAFIGAATEQRLADIETRLTALEAE